MSGATAHQSVRGNSLPPRNTSRQPAVMKWPRIVIVGARINGWSQRFRDSSGKLNLIFRNPVRWQCGSDAGDSMRQFDFCFQYPALTDTRMRYSGLCRYVPVRYVSLRFGKSHTRATYAVSNYCVRSTARANRKRRLPARSLLFPGRRRLPVCRQCA